MLKLSVDDIIVSQKSSNGDEKLRFFGLVVRSWFFLIRHSGKIAPMRRHNTCSSKTVRTDPWAEQLYWNCTGESGRGVTSITIVWGKFTYFLFTLWKVELFETANKWTEGIILQCTKRTPNKIKIVQWRLLKI